MRDVKKHATTRGRKRRDEELNKRKEGRCKKRLQLRHTCRRKHSEGQRRGGGEHQKRTAVRSKESHGYPEAEFPASPPSLPRPMGGGRGRGGGGILLAAEAKALPTCLFSTPAAVDEDNEDMSGGRRCRLRRRGVIGVHFEGGLDRFRSRDSR